MGAAGGECPAIGHRPLIIILDGSGSSDGEGAIATWQWSHESGPAASLNGGNTASPTFAAPDTAGAIVLELTVTDEAGNEATDTVTITVDALPVAEAGDDQSVAPDTVVTLDGSGSSDNEGAVTYSWALTSSSPTASVTLSSNTAESPTFTSPNTEGTLTFTLTVTDSAGGVHSDTVAIQIDATAPRANAGSAQTVAIGATVTLDGSASSDTGGSGIASYRWTQKSGTPNNITLTGGDTASPTFTAPDAVTILVFTLAVTDEVGNASTNTAEVTITIEDQNPPTAEAGDAQTVNVGADVTLSGTGSDDEGTVIYAWALTSPADLDVSLTGADSASPTFTAPTTTTSLELVFTLTVTDEGGNETTDTVTITVEDQNAPTANAGEDRTVGPGAVRLDGSTSSDGEGGDLTYAWTITANPGSLSVSLDDATIPRPTFTAPDTAGTLTFSLVVTDEAGNASTADTVTITIEAGLPNVDAGVDQAVGANAAVTLSGSGSSNSGGSVTYRWTQSGPSTLTLSGEDAATASFTSPTTTGTYILTLTVTDTGTSVTASDSVTIRVDATAPVANAGDPQTVAPSADVTLDGSASSDGEGAVTYRWALTASDPSATLSDLTGADTAAPTFTAPSTAGTLTFTLTVTDEVGNEHTDTVIITVNAPPVADAGDDQTVSGNDTVTLNGSGSSDNEGAVTYSWALTASSPTASVTLSSNTAESPTFTSPNTEGTLTFTLTVTDSADESSTDTVTITVDATDPTAEAGADQTVNFGAGVTLDGSGSSDGQTRIASYSWVLTTSSPTATVTLTGEDTAAPTFTAPGTATALTFTLTVTDAGGNMAEDTVMVTVQDGNAPTADAGDAQTVAAGTQVTLDASGSSDAEGTVTYSWALTASNPTATLNLSSSTAEMPTFTHSAAGTLTFTLTVSDEADNRDTDTVTITVDALPVAVAGAAQTVNAGATVTLDGSGSSDNEGVVTYRWALNGDPDTTGVSLSSTTAEMPTFTAPSTETTLTFTLTVTDTFGSEVMDTVEITVEDMNAPNANAGSDQTVASGATVTLDGSGSSDGEGSIATWEWMRERGTMVTLTGDDTATPTFTAPNTAGDIVFELTVTDGAGNEATTRVTITVNPVPVADAGDDQSVMQGASVTLDGSGSSDDEGAVTYSWALTDSTPTASVTLSDSTAESPTFTAPNLDTTLTFTLTVADSLPSEATDLVVVTVDGTNPVANAGPAQNVSVGSTVTLDGSASTDAGSGIASHSWALTGSSPTASVTLTGGDTAAPTFTAPDATGTLTFTLTVTDGAGNTHTNDVVITVNDPLTAEAGGDQFVMRNMLVTLDGSARGGSGGYTYSWAKTSGPAATLSDLTAAMPTFTSPDLDNSFIFTLTVRDSSGERDTDTVRVVVDGARPTANIAGAANRTVATGSMVTLDGSVSTDIGGSGIGSYLWEQTGGLDVDLTGENTDTLTFTAPDTETTLSFRLRVTDRSGNMDENLAIVNLNVMRPLAVEAGDDRNVAPGSSVTLRATITGGVGDKMAVWSDEAETSTVTDLTATSPGVATFTAPVTLGDIVFRVTVTDSEGTGVSDTVTIAVVDENPPTAEAGDGQAVRTSSSVTLDGSASRDGETALTYSWALTDSTPSATVTLAGDDTASPTFTAPATPTMLTFTLTVTDEGGNEAMDTVTVTVRSEVTPPTANAGDDRRVSPGSAVTLDGSGSTDDVAVATYLWAQTSGHSTVTLNAPNTARPSFTPADPGIFTFTLTATDAAGNSANDTVMITAAGAGDRFIVSKNQDPRVGAGDFALGFATGIIIEGERALIASGGNESIIAVDLGSGDRTELSQFLVSGSTGEGERLERPRYMALDASNERLLVIDSGRDTLFAVDIDDGDRTILSRGGDDAMGTGDAFDDPWGLVLDSSNNRAFVTDRELDAVVSVSLATATLGNRTLFSRADSTPDDGDDTAVGSGDAFDTPYAVVLDSANNRLLVADAGLDAIVAVSLATATQGNRTIFSGGSSPVGSGDAFDTPRDLVLDSANNRLLVVDAGLDAIVEVALDTGNRSIFSRGGESPTGNGVAFSTPVGLALDSANERLLVTDQYPTGGLNFRDAVVAVYLTDPEDPAE